MTFKTLYLIVLLAHVIIIVNVITTNAIIIIQGYAIKNVIREGNE